MNKISLVAAGVMLLLASLWADSASAQFDKPKDAEDYRAATMTLISSHFTRMDPVMKGKKPYDKAEIQANVAILSTLAALPWQAFPEGTQSEYALADIWKDPAGFKAAQQKFTSAVAKLSAAADTGDLAQIKKAFGAVGASCKSCHDVYHEKK